MKLRNIFRDKAEAPPQFIKIVTSYDGLPFAIAHLHHDDIIDYIFKSMYMERCLHWAQ